jgi:hypothetical protein
VGRNTSSFHVREDDLVIIVYGLNLKQVLIFLFVTT